MKTLLPLAGLAACTFLMMPSARAQDRPLELPTPIKADETADAFVWVIAPDVGSRWQMRTFTRTQSSQIMPAIAARKASQTESIVLQTLVADYDVLSRDIFGATTTRITFREMDIDISVKVNGQTMPMITDPVSARLKRAFRGANFTVKQAPSGAIWNVMGLQAMQKRLLNAVADDAASRAQMEAFNKSLFSPEAARKMMAQAGAMPAYPIRAGESWAYAVELPVGLPFSARLAGTRTINLLTPDTAFISDDALYRGWTSVTPIDMGDGTKMSYDMSGVEGGLLGTSRVDRASGLTRESTLFQRLGGAVMLRQTDFAGRVKYAESLPISIVTTGRTVLEPR